MANYKKLTDVEVMEEVSESTMALVEDNGKLKKVPCGAGFGSGGGVATAIIKDVMNYDNAIAGVSAAVSAEPANDYQCINMTFEDAWQLMISGEPLDVLIMGFYGECSIVHPIYIHISTFNTPCIHMCTGVPNGVSSGNIMETMTLMDLYWTADGITDWNPNAAE